MFFIPVSLSGPPQGSSNNFWGLKVHPPYSRKGGVDHILDNQGNSAAGAEKFFSSFVGKMLKSQRAKRAPKKKTLGRTRFLVFPVFWLKTCMYSH